MIQQLRTHTALAEKLSLVPSTHIKKLQGFWLSCGSVMHPYTCTDIHINYNNSKTPQEHEP